MLSKHERKRIDDIVRKYLTRLDTFVEREVKKRPQKKITSKFKTRVCTECGDVFTYKTSTSLLCPDCRLKVQTALVTEL